MEVLTGRWSQLEPDQQKEIARLRVDAWEAVGVRLAKAADGEFVDEFDADAQHFRVLQPEVAGLAAAGRVTMHSFGSKLPDGLEWADAGNAPRVAVIGRLVVHPSARGLGCAKAIDEARLKVISEWVPNAPVLVISSTRQNALVALGFRLVRLATSPSTQKEAAVLVRLPNGADGEGAR